MSYAGPSNSRRVSGEPRPRSSSSISSQTTQRPPSSLSSRPQSSLSVRNTPSRPSSSASQRPPSSASHRPTSSASTRPHSRYSHRPSSRHARSRLIPQCQILVSQVTGLKEEGFPTDVDEKRFKVALEYTVKSLETTTLNKAAVGVDLTNTDRQISGQALKARINSRDALGEALQRSYIQLKALVAKDNDLDQEIKLSRLPDHLQLLLTLSSTPSQETLAYANDYLERLKNPPLPPPALTWKEILAEEPFEGEHWEGVYGLPPGSVRGAKDEEKNDWDSTPSLSPLNSDDLALDDDDTISSIGDSNKHSAPEANVPPEPVVDELPPSYTYAHRKELESLQSKQYWRKEWHTDANPNQKFSLGDPSTLGPAITTASVSGSTRLASQILLQNEKYINEENAVREVLMALQGRENIILQWVHGEYTTKSSTPKLIHLSEASQLSILSSFAQFSSVVQRLRQFVTSVFSQPRIQQVVTSGRKPATRTCEAFADALDFELRALESWCAAREEAVCRASAGLCDHALIVSLLSTEMSLRGAFETSFEVCLEIVNKIFQISEDAQETIYNGTGRRQPSAVTTLLLDTLFSSVQEHMERKDSVTSNTLTRVFVRTAEPLWDTIGKWLRDGMGAGLGIDYGGFKDELDDEFFIENNIGLLGMGLLHPNFWEEGYSLRGGHVGDDGPDSARKVTPAFLQHVAHHILSTGKAVGLIRALGFPSKIPDLHTWQPFTDVVKSEQKGTAGQGLQDTIFSVSVDRLSKLIYDRLLPRCSSVGEVLAMMLVNECELWRHLEAIEDMFFMRRGDTMSHFIDLLFGKMDTQQSWGDFHFLNTAFQDVVEANGGQWVQASLVRLSYRSGGIRDRDKNINRTVKAIEGLTLEYSVPFPLTYIFRPTSLQIYNEIFVFFLQVRRAKSILERILVRSKAQIKNRTDDELKSFYALRGRLSWFVNTLLNFLTTYVVQEQVLKFHEEIRKASSLDEMIQFHDDHLEKIQGRCLLKPNTAALHRAILSVLDICLHFSEAFIMFAGNTTATHDVSRQSIILKRHRSCRRGRQKRNIVGFSQEYQDSESSSEDEIEDEADISGADTTEGPSFSFTSSSFSQEDGYIRIDKVSSELDGLIRFIRRGVESLAGGSGEAAPAFGVLAFALEDWDL